MGAYNFISINKINPYWNSLRKLDHLASEDWERIKNFCKVAVREIRDTLDFTNKDRLCRGECTLLLVQEHTDRLVVIVTTAARLFYEKEDVDKRTNRPFYSLFREEKDGELKEYHRKKRGLTGWIFLNGKSLLINDEKNRDEIIKGVPSGFEKPVWGHNISEVPVDEPDPSWTARFVGCPIYLNQRVVGVLRFTRLGGTPELDQDDLTYIQAAAGSISFNINILTKLRMESAKAKLQMLPETEDMVGQFMDILHEAFNAQIISIYTYSNGRLTMSHERGIGLTKKEMQNIWYDGKERNGATWFIFNSKETIQEDDIKGHAAWKGLYHKIYYRSAPDYTLAIRIPFLGGPIGKDLEQPLGVLKIEFPELPSGLTTFTEEDKRFFECICLPKLTRILLTQSGLV